MTPRRRRRPSGRWGVVAKVAAVASILSAVSTGAALSRVSAATTTDPAVGAASSPAGGGWETTASGAVTSIGGAPYYGSVAGRVSHPVVGMAATPDGLGYWLVASDGGIFAFGDARFAGSTGAIRLNQPIVGMAPTADGQGYWLVASDGGIFSFGDARFFGSTGAIRLNQPIVGMASTTDGGGYWLVASDGGIFSFGDARFFGSTGALHLNKPVTGIAATHDGGGYWLVASDGGVFSFGDASFLGSLGSSRVSVAALAPMAAGDGYILVQPDGTALPFVAPVGGAPAQEPGAPLVATAPPATVPPVTTPPPATPPSPTPPVTDPPPAGALGLGVLAADANDLASDQAAGIDTATLNFSWRAWEPAPGVFDPGVVAWVQGVVASYRAVGWRINVDVGLQAPPTWVLQGGDGRLVDQYGAPSAMADFEFSASVRAAASAYIADVVSSLSGIQGYRIGLSENGETLYPDTSGNQWWAFAPSAQLGGPDLPAGVGISPMPGWIPGSTTWQGAPVTTAQVQAWYSWYSGASYNAHAWEMAAFRQAGFTGQLQLVMPGTGALPWVLAERIGNDLRPSADDPYSTLNTAAVWWQMLDDLPSLSGAVLDISSVYDGSGSPRGNGCQAGDSTVSYSDPQVFSWSDTRWLAALAQRHGLATIGENPGYTPVSDLAGTVALARSCGLSTLQWAWDDLLHNGSGVTAAQLGAAAA